MNNKRFLVIGASGFIGRFFCQTLDSHGEQYLGTSLTQEVPTTYKFDLLRDNIERTFSNIDSFTDAIFLASKPQLEFCRAYPELSYKINVDKTIEAISVLSNKGVKITFISSDAVFSGDERGNYTENCLAKPNTLYGKHKLLVEEYLNKYVPNSLIVRLSKNFGVTLGDGTLLSTWYKKIMSDQRVCCVSDMYFSPTYVKDTVKAIYMLLKSEKTGSYHVASPHRHSRLTLAKEFLRFLKKDVSSIESVRACDLMKTEIYPKDTSLCSDKLIREFGFQFTSLQTSFHLFGAENNLRIKDR